MTDNRTTEQNATERLRALLDERGVEHEDASYKRKVPITVWDSDGAMFCFVDDFDKTDLHVENCTPEQAIAATLGSGTCEVEYVNDWMGWHCLKCDNIKQGLKDQKPNYCPNCGRKVKE